MAIKSNLALIAIFGALISAVFLARESLLLLKANRYNIAITSGDFKRAAEVDNDHGTFARAFSMQEEGAYHDARLLYASLDASKNKGLALQALYNLGNTYLEQAQTVDLRRDADVAIPLIELAKITYRDVLKRDSSHWAAKHNLEVALALSPDSRTLPTPAIPGRRAPNRTVISIDPEDSLP